ncbi:hypothetical protein [Streptomyces noursei]|uniref:hypothetical protein n=1 Tax=Streptomyces noursei TaxID=1971 RepID=UPI0016764CC5|nr:hypothetical protein [Streptomyces noursei]MCZ1020306.1 hypothetical protein [Streptomyces noursei]
MTGPRWVAVFTKMEQGKELEILKPVAGWDDGNALILDRKAGRLVQASKESGFVAVRESAGYTHAVPAPPGWTVRWCKDGADDIVDPVVAFMEDPFVNGGTPLIADLETCIVKDIHWMARYDVQRRGCRPILMPSASGSSDR